MGEEDKSGLLQLLRCIPTQFSGQLDRSLGEIPESLQKWKTDEGRVVPLLGFHLDGPALRLFEMERE